MRGESGQTGARNLSDGLLLLAVSEVAPELLQPQTHILLLDEMLGGTFVNTDVPLPVCVEVVVLVEISS